MKRLILFFVFLAAQYASGSDRMPSEANSFDAGDPKGVSCRITIEDSSKLLGESKVPFRDNLLAAADLWCRYLKGKTTIDVLVKIEPGAGRAMTRCPKMTFLKKIGRNSLFEPSACTKVRTGRAETKGHPDIEMTIRGDYLPKFWFDPAPLKRTTAVPRDRFDAVSLFLHELAHGLGFNGWIDPKTGELEVETISTYDRLVIHEGGEFYFVGLRAMKVHGGPLLLSHRNNNYHHLGCKIKDCPKSLRTDLMNGVLFEYGRRYSISPLDRAILEDCGLPTKATAR